MTSRFRIVSQAVVVVALLALAAARSPATPLIEISMRAEFDSALTMPATAATVAISDTVDSLAFPDAEKRGWQVGLMRPDRLQHASVSLTITLATGLMTRDPLVGLGTGLAAGVGKEAWDARTTGFDWVDLAADALGCAIAAAAAAAIVP